MYFDSSPHGALWLFVKMNSLFNYFRYERMVYQI